MLSKRRSNIIHFKRRLFERYGIDISGNEVDRLAVLVTNGGRKYFIRRLSGSRSLYKIPICNVEVLAIYDKNQHSLLTALPVNSENE